MVYFSLISLLGSSFSDQPNKEHAMRRIQIEEQAKNTYIPLSLSKKINILQVEKRGLFIPQTFTVQYPEYPLPASMRRVYSEFFLSFLQLCHVQIGFVYVITFFTPPSKPLIPSLQNSFTRRPPFPCPRGEASLESRPDLRRCSGASWCPYQRSMPSCPWKPGA